MYEILRARNTIALVLFMAAALGGVALRAADSSGNAGQEAFAQCAACHSTDGSNGVGPSLKGIVGRASGGAPGFAYSNAMKHARLTWTAATLDKYIANPQAVVPGNVMPYAGMSDPGQRSALIAYLSTLK
ncbi:c-type cytochrome [Povalibacter sp.]|uniref:c-type cytochrome n=1 Tax=Povalibacter sp. TaxID=1962978 RepID=UPI002F41CDBD